MKELCRFQQSALLSTAELQATRMTEGQGRHISVPGLMCSGASVPPQAQVRAIKSQQKSASRERVNKIQGIQSTTASHGTDRAAAALSVLTGFGEEGVHITPADATAMEARGGADASMEVCFGPPTSFVHVGKGLAARLTLNKKQRIAFLIVCRQLDLLGQNGKADIGQLCQFATSGTAAARINGITIHSACGFSKDLGAAANAGRDLDGVWLAKQTERFVHGQSRMDWQEKEMLVIDERRKGGKAPKDDLFCCTDSSADEVFSSAKVVQARQKMTVKGPQQQEEALKKDARKLQRQQKAAEQKLSL
ncbi:hypothetical protein HIM_11295 [Hirsutella minnesotensis 3608]|uniref:Uncharacterized protein n=1 Tax=Hirsutella minnesotensis 3608 TaxID=1043627 RepID=A0A0F7ZWP2_9HYPO|nr:hypothetical protein HIM_11295 [Hirsutella minnesotensis 3608]